MTCAHHGYGEVPDDFYYVRDHGAWCVRGPNGFNLQCDDKNCAYILGKMLSGKYEEAQSMAQFVAAMARV